MSMVFFEELLMGKLPQNSCDSSYGDEDGSTAGVNLVTTPHDEGDQHIPDGGTAL